MDRAGRRRQPQRGVDQSRRGRRYTNHTILLLTTLLAVPSSGEARAFRFACRDFCYTPGAFIRCDEGRLDTRACLFRICPPPCADGSACHPCNGGRIVTVPLDGRQTVTVSLPVEDATYLLTCRARRDENNPQRIVCPFLKKITRYVWKGTLTTAAGVTAAISADMTSRGCDQYGFCKGHLTCRGAVCPGRSAVFGLDGEGFVLGGDTGELAFPSLRHPKVYCALLGQVDWSGDRSVQAPYSCGRAAESPTTGTLVLTRQWGSSE